MKRLILMLCFTAYTFVIPFILVNCSVADEPYVKADELGISAENQLAQCRSLEFVTADCVDVLQAAESALQSEEAAVKQSALLIDDFIACEAEENISDAAVATLKKISNLFVEDAAANADTTTTTTTTTACGTIISSMVSAYQICDGKKISEKYDDCWELENAVEDATWLCDQESDQVTTDFCSSLTV